VEGLTCTWWMTHVILSFLTFQPYHLLPWSSNHHYPHSTHFIFQYNLIPSQGTLSSFNVQIHCSFLVTWKVLLIFLVTCENTLESFPNPYIYPRHTSKSLIPSYPTKTFFYLVQVLSNPSFFLLLYYFINKKYIFHLVLIFLLLLVVSPWASVTLLHYLRIGCS